jgi:O-antigen/teichoic acid export membrane protein
MSSEPQVKPSLPVSEPPSLALAEGMPPEVSPGSGFGGVFDVQAIFDRLRGLKDILRLKPFDTTHDEGRSRERYRRAALTTLASVLGKGVNVFTSLLTVRLTLRYLGTERYGLWMSVTSIVSLLFFADLGIGNGLLNSIAEARGRDDVDAVHRSVSSAFFVLVGITAVFLSIFLAVYPVIPWPRVFNVSSPISVHEAGPAVMIFIFCFLSNIPLDVVQRVQTGYQEGYLANFWTMFGNLAGLGFLLIVMHRRGGLPWLILAILGGGILGVLGNWVQEFAFARPELLPKLSYWDRATAHKILGTGVMFFLLQICGILTLPLDYIIITQVLGPEAVTQYAVPVRPFLLVISVASMFVFPLWPAYGEAYSRGDLNWVKSTFRHSLVYSMMVFGPVVLVLGALGKILIRLWVGSQVHPSWPLLSGMACYAVLLIFYNPISTFLSGINKMKFQVAVWLAQGVIAALLKIVFAKAFGITGVIWAAAVMAFIGNTLLFVYARRVLTHSAAPVTQSSPA